MKSIVWLAILAAAFATGVLGFLVLRGPERREPPAPGTSPAPPPARAAPAEEALRPHETDATLREDLRDALAGPGEALGAEVARVSGRVAPRARRILLETAAQEASPKVRALLVLAAGVHVPDDGILLAYLDDREDVVRRAAALAAARADGGRKVALLPGVEVSTGRELPEATRRALEARLLRDQDEGVRGTLAAALGR